MQDNARMHAASCGRADPTMNAPLHPSCSPFAWLFLPLVACTPNAAPRDQGTTGFDTSSRSAVTEGSDTPASPPGIKGTIDPGRIAVRLNHHINTGASEYHPCPLPNGDLVFSAMDRTGFFEQRIDFTRTRKAGGEDVFVARLKDGIWEDARPLADLSTNAHEVVTQARSDGSFVLMGNYPENMGPANDANGAATPDLFLAVPQGDGFRIQHLPEPVSSIYGDYDGHFTADGRAILFASDRPGHMGAYHKKGWRWNDNLWGNTDLYVCLQEGGLWTAPIHLGTAVNTPGAERTPWLSADGLTLYTASNGYGEYADMDILRFTRRSAAVWDEWDGPYRVADACSEDDDWGYAEDATGVAWFARSMPLPYKTTRPARDGDAYVRETNSRPGYTVTGAPSAALNKQFQTDIFRLVAPAAPTVTLPDVLFAFNSAQLQPQAQEALDRLVDLLKQNEALPVRVEGHTDNVGKADYNRDLSQERAAAVVDYLQGHGIAAARLVAVGHGDTRPLAPNNTPEERQRNRRVDVVLGE
jgi:outer membrane protein OmpA-like peptidoglycan-associated protein